jgi:hypothetical protein
LITHENKNPYEPVVKLGAPRSEGQAGQVNEAADCRESSVVSASEPVAARARFDGFVEAQSARFDAETMGLAVGVGHPALSLPAFSQLHGRMQA